MRSDLVVSGIHVAPNSKVETRVQVLELNDSTALEIPLTLVNGSSPGPTVFIGAGAHGTEYTSILAAIEIAAQLKPEAVNGAVICAPIQSMYAFRERQRNVTLNDEEGYNLHRAFPGDPDGGPPFRMTHFLFQRLVLDPGVAFAFDLHTCSHTHVGPAHSFVAPKSFGEAAAQAQAAAEVFGTKMMVQDQDEWDPMTQRGVYAQTDMPHMIGAKYGIPILGLELVENKIVSDEDVRTGSAGIENVLRLLGVLDGDPPARVPQTVIREVVYVRNNRGGLIRQRIGPGSFVREGDVLAVILNPFGGVVETIKAPVGGHVMTVIASSAIHEGEMVARIGIEESER
jgi:predicted deacylase